MDGNTRPKIPTQPSPSAPRAPHSKAWCDLRYPWLHESEVFFPGVVFANGSQYFHPKLERRISQRVELVRYEFEPARIWVLDFDEGSYWAYIVKISAEEDEIVW